jgi:hypothetical protein
MTAHRHATLTERLVRGATTHNGPLPAVAATPGHSPTGPSGWCTPTLIKMALAGVALLYALLPRKERFADGEVYAVSMDTRVRRAIAHALFSALVIFLMFHLCLAGQRTLAWGVLLLYPILWLFLTLFVFSDLISDRDDEETGGTTQ